MALLLPHAVSAQEEDDAPVWLDLAKPPDPADRIIQRRKYELAHEFVVSAGELASDPYYKGLCVGLGYAFHFNHDIAWEILNLVYAFHFDTNLKRELEQIVASAATQLPAMPMIDAYAASHLVLKPFYGKQALRDWALLHFEAFVQVGPAAARVSNQLDVRLAPGLDWGLGFRLWQSEVLSLRGSVGQLLFYTKGGVRQNLHVDVAVSLNAGGNT